MNKVGDLSVNEFDVSEYAVSTTGVSEAGRAGTPAKHSAFSFWVKLDDGSHSVLYGHLLGGAWMSPEATRIEVRYSGLHRYKGEWVDGVWLAVITGKRLGYVYECLAKGVWQDTNVVANGDKAEVTKTEIVLVKLLEDHG